jgi:hypothetical protein
MLIDRRLDPLGMIGIRALNALRMTVVNENRLVSISAKAWSCLTGRDVRNAGKLAIVGETRVLPNCGYGTPNCQTLNQAPI